MEREKAICEQFLFEGELVMMKRYGDGHINDTYKVTYKSQDDKENIYILQRINGMIFKDFKVLMDNVVSVTSYLKEMIEKEDIEDDYTSLELVKTKRGDYYILDEEGGGWRAYYFVYDGIGYTFTEDLALLEAAGKAFGNFQKLLKDYPVEKLVETIPDFHHTPKRLEQFKEAVEKDCAGRVKTCEEAVKFVLDREGDMGIIVEGLACGDMPIRVTHNDTKLNNILINPMTKKGKCVIDLDTVMPGSSLYDFGDAIRSCGSTEAEDSEDLEALQLDLQRFAAYTKGYLEAVGDTLTERELELLPEAAILMTLECGMRFLADYLNGDIYFKVHKEKHNLIRAKNQFKFVREMEKHKHEMKEVIKIFSITKKMEK